MTAIGVSADGSIIVGSSLGVPQSDRRPAIWDAVNGSRYLVDVLVNELNLGNAMAGWKLNIAKGISGDGRSVIGYGTNPQGNTEGWIAYLGPSAPIPGDFNNDGTVDAADYVVWRNGLGATYTQTHYNLWRAHFGQTAATAAAHVWAAGSSTPAVAEPATLTLFALLLVRFVTRWRPAHVTA